MKIRRLAGLFVLSGLAFFYLYGCGGGGGDSAPPGPAAPTVTTSALSIPGIDNALINGNVNPNGLATTAWFEYGTDSSLANPTRTDNQVLGSGKAPASINTTLTGLDAGTPYYFRAAASSTAGTKRGAIKSFSTLFLVPTVVTTTSAPGIDNAAVNGNVNPNGLETTAWFEYGTDQSLSTSDNTVGQLIGSGKVAVPVTATLTLLGADTTYYWRAAASNAAGTKQGTIKSFTTTPIPPPIADPGPDQTVFMGHSVTLDGSGSSDPAPGGSITSYEWTQTAGTAVTLSDNTVATPTFTAPSVLPPSEVLTFSLTVTSDRGPSATDNVNVTVRWGFFDDGSTDTTGEYTVEITRGTTGTFEYDPSGQRLHVTNGDDQVLRFSHSLAPSNEGVFSLDFSPISTYPTHGGIWVRLYLAPLIDNTYYEISNFDWSEWGFSPTEPDLAAFRKFVDGVETEIIPFNTSYLQGSTYPIKITFGSAITTMEAFGTKIELSGTGTSDVVEFAVSTGQQDVYYDNIVWQAGP